MTVIPFFLKTRHDGFIRLEAMFVFERLERGYQNIILISMVGNHEVLVTAPRLYWELSRIFRIQFADMHCVHVKFV